ncbi:DUF6691 family protein [Pseudotabrizicola alkalilacus]|uniref:YeeE/YedE family protein n=1 Tax=Pseudotabrizicola alkalilacus TaxID=2305252 RepID=A0A411Z1F8_9RHOB|nr:DUF6691 family protein [Pseudotabrizicola alkalilacus]RGP36894.1 hypothetical protein D1012_12130 [Pseudotabrizicola alkalilacus]
MKRMVFSALSGALFGAGLLVSGMVDTVKVQGWLDVFGAWDPTLAFVMGGAILPMAIAWQVAERRKTAVLGTPIPDRLPQKLDRNLILGSVLFGAGWGLVGLCPGPAFAAAFLNGASGLVFLVAMLAAMVATPALRRALTPKGDTAWTSAR